VKAEEVKPKIGSIECGVVDQQQNANFAIVFAKPFSRPPTVLLTGHGKKKHSPACLVGTPTTAGFTARIIHCNGAWDQGKVHWLAICDDGGGASAALRSGVHTVAAGGDWAEEHTVGPCTSAGGTPTVILTGGGDRRHSIACLIPQPVTPLKFQARLVHTDRSWETGPVHWLATGQDELSAAIPGALCGIVEMDAGRDFDVAFALAFEHPPVVVLTAEGRDKHSIACFVDSGVTAAGFRARIVTAKHGGWDQGRLHWVAIPANVDS
jgi:hypothetical protein